MFLPHISVLKCLILREPRDNHCAKSGSWDRLKHIYIQIKEAGAEREGQLGDLRDMDSKQLKETAVQGETV